LRRPVTVRALTLLVLAAALAGLLAPAARAAGDMDLGIADDRALMFDHDQARAARTVVAWRDLGIDRVRLLAQWQQVSPDAGARRPPDGFDVANPDDPRYDWSALDRGVRMVRAAGLQVMLSVTGPGPLWATSSPAGGNRRAKPRPDLFGRFARAVALRYGPDVDRYIVWNEPNIPLWLQPQFTCRGRSCTPYAPHLYRRLVQAAWSGIHGADGDARVLMGALAPRGQNPRSRNAIMRPLTFLRALGCVGDRLQRLRTGSCRGFQPAQAEGIAYHPHSVLRAPDEPNPNPDEAALADLSRLERLLDGIQRRNGLRNTLGRTRPFDLHFTEYGYQTRPPDPRDGVRLSLQAKWLQQAAFIAWHDPRVRNVTQYEWRDEPLSRGVAGWQSGLRFVDDRPKPALHSFPQPFWAQPLGTGRTARLWGQVRPGGVHDVSLQRRAPGARTWTTFRRVRTTGRGFFTLTVAVNRRLDYRFTWRESATTPLRASDPRRLTPPARKR
ncbi:MAG: hypothetical protein QOD73_697, partial [Solirubrobacteraceae bacterium]|nr:hypothetical protein [Solirubrobacteraceae bacterium]